MMKVLAALAFLALASANVHDRAFYEEKFFEWLKEHKVVAQSGSNFVHMLQNFANNHDLIETHNAGTSTYTLGHNKFSHMNIDEWRTYVHQGLNRPQLRKQPASIHTAPADVSTLAGSVDWVSAGAVSGVKDQGQCGSCWSFSSTGALEGGYKVKNGGSVPSFSEQHLVDCDLITNGGNDLGCKGGLMDSAFDWVNKNGYICSESEYPYTSGTTQKAGSCSQSTCVKNAKSAPASYTDVATNSDSALMSALNMQPVSVAIEADKASFQLYKSGVYSDPACGTSLDHGVLAVGYGTDATGGDFWNVKNSWGTTWGDAGYIKMARNVAGAGQCGILSGPPSFPNMA